MSDGNKTAAQVHHAALLVSLPYFPADACRTFQSMIEECGLTLDTPDTLRGDIDFLIQQATALQEPYEWIINLRKSKGRGKGIDFGSVMLTLSVAQQRYLQLTMPNEPIRSAILNQGIDEQAYAISEVMQPNPVRIPRWVWVGAVIAIALFMLIIFWPAISKLLGIG